ncbi:MAG TPA: ATP-dependent DNA helicase RecG [Mycobacteriales bacterium]|jgi:ATP-dependent DNA helicase RecG|nr:ATP-dependent DNA helicase RecG [Mycobacteriales bacterium]
MARLDTPLEDLVGGKTATPLAKGLDLETVGDLLRHYPRRYAERGKLTNLRDLSPGEDVTVFARVSKVGRRQMRARRGTIVEAEITDGQGTLKLTFFNQPWREKELEVGRQGLFAGKVTVFNGKRQLNSPDFRILDAEESKGDIEEFAGALIPVYPATSATPTWTIARCVRMALDSLDPPVDPLPSGIRARHDLIDLESALRGIHRPADYGALERARKRLKWEEALPLQALLAQRRRAAAERPGKARPPRTDGILAAFDAALPFPLTGGQVGIGETLASELASEHPMHRLLQGEVGSGKTVCALRAMLQVVDAGGQAALLAPTEVLAAQHARSLAALLGPLARAGELDGAEQATRIALLTGSLPVAAKRRAMLAAVSGDAGIVVGTHALLSEGVEFLDLGLVVVDEQHRFGVEQRDALRAKGDAPHVLVMTATPIPRTVAMTVYGDLEVSSLRELPRGRSPIASTVVPAGEKPSWLDRVWTRIKEEVAAGHQAYVVCPRIGGTDPDEDEEPSEEDGESRRPPIAVLDVAPGLAEGPLHGLRVRILHGRLPAEEKDAVMRAFAAAEVDVLVATTVVEVGVDVPNATVMAVLDADRFGISQLHQLRGRVGRGSAPGLCLLVTDSPAGTPARERLDAVASTVDGFELAELDLEQRREGQVLGEAQSGRSSFKLLSLIRDRDLITTAREEASTIVAADPELADHPGLAAAVTALTEKERSEFLEKT